MSLIRRFFLAFAVVAALSASTTLLLATPQAPQSAPASAELSQKLPVDPDVTTGAFPNGLKYYLRKNGLPEKRAELRLVVNVGSLMEEDDQQGLAHFVEHMAFNGTKNFPKSDIVTFMESIGMRFGPSVNAFTSFDETVYMLQIPTDKADVIDRSLLILEDWAHNLSFDPVEIDKERGVIMEEWRLRRGAGARMQDQQLPILLKGSRYAERLPIGKTEVIQGFKHDRLKQFYTDWYRPDLMAVIAVGDFDQAAMQASIQKHFSGLPRATKPKPRPAYDVPKQPGTLFAVATDPEAPGTQVSIYSKMAFRDPSTVGAYRTQLVERLFGSMLSARFAEISQKPDAPFMSAGTFRGLFVKSAEASTLMATAKDGKAGPTIEALFTEAERVTKFGFTQSEFDRQKTALLRGIQQQLAEKDKRQSGQLADEYVRNFTQAEPFPGLQNEVNITERMLPGISLTEVNGLAREWMPEGNRVVLVSAPKKPGAEVPDEATMTAAIKAAASKPITAYADTTSARPLFSATPKTGAVTKSNVRADVGITEWTLSNGVRVILKPTTFKQDEIVFRAFSPGGTSLAADDELIWAEPAAALMQSSGLGSFSRIELGKMLAGKIAGVAPYIGALDEGLSGSASVKDVETMFQLIYMTFTEPRADRNVFEVMKGQTKMMLGNMQSNPNFVFSEALNDALTQGHPREKTPTPADLDKMDLDKALTFYKDRFADASDFTFVFVGSFEPVTLRPFVEQYLASLPSTGRKETFKDHNVRPPSTVVERKVEKGLEPQSHTQIVFTGPFEYNQTQRIAIRAVASILQTRLREILREDLGGTYSVSASAGYDKFPRQQYTFTVDFGSSPDRAEELSKRVFAEIEAFRTNGPTEKQVADAKEGFIRDFETQIKTNGYLLQQISVKYQFGEDNELPVLFDLPTWYSRLTLASVQAASRQYLNAQRYVKVTLMPEKR
ncbi:MAG TPA: insulinase family protein [Vicinamibacterales bacterium]|nr:insulinase family protein [Vicinamibacterales bacterium]